MAVVFEDRNQERNNLTQNKTTLMYELTFDHVLGLSSNEEMGNRLLVDTNGNRFILEHCLSMHGSSFVCA